MVIFQNMETYLNPLGRFINPHIKNDKRSFFDFLRWKAGYYNDHGMILPPPNEFSYPIELKQAERHRPSVTWIGHSTFLVECEGLTLLTDPIFEEYCAPVRLQALKRRSELPLAITDLPKLDVVLISHNHYDHLDEKTVQTLFRQQPQILWIVPKGLVKWFYRRGITRCIELGWWESMPLQACQVTAVPTQHFSGRSLWDKNKTHWNGYVVEKDGKKLYFVGDTGYNSHDFKQIGFRFGTMDLSLIPIGSYIPERFMSPVHSSPLDAVQIHLDVRSRLSIGMHWNTFCLSDEPMGRPPYDLYLAMKEKNLPFDTFVPIDIGAKVNW
jgi:N-acyl-phosphatidylethanolamine-hydrolysing phospholipase D